MKRTKIVCTIGPSSSSLDMLEKMARAGMDVARLNFSHGKTRDHVDIIKRVRKVSEKLDKPIGILQDIQGPKIRLGDVIEPFDIGKGKKIILSKDDVLGDSSRLSLSYPEILEGIKEGDNVFIDDGIIELEVEKVTGEGVLTKVLEGGYIASKKGITFPRSMVDLPTLTEKDVKDIGVGVDQEIDFIAVSFVRTSHDLLEVHNVLKDLDGDVPLIAKLENRKALENLKDIVDMSYGVMVARGDLGINIPVETLPVVQKEIISICDSMRKPVIIATQMLESMIHEPKPTRAEVSDVANAIFDGTDAVMLSGETASGKHPIESVKYMSRIAVEAEKGYAHKQMSEEIHLTPSHNLDDVIAHSANQITRNLEIKAIIVPTQTGNTARKVARYRPSVPIIGITTEWKTERLLTLSWGVIPLKFERKDTTTDMMIDEAVHMSLEKGYVSSGDQVVMISGRISGISGTTNLLKVHLIAREIAKGIGVGDGQVTGKVVTVFGEKDCSKKIETDAVVVLSSERDDFPGTRQAAAILSDAKELTSYPANLGREFGIPVILAIPHKDDFYDGLLVTLDLDSGVIYEGKIDIGKV